MPDTGTLEDWKTWILYQQKNYPIRWWFADQAPHVIYNNTLGKIKQVRNWWKLKYKEGNHIIPTGLKPGIYESDELMLHACFSVLKGYIENDKAWLNHMSNFVFEDVGTDPRFIKESEYIWKHSPKEEYGLEYLDWEISLDPMTNDPTSQSYIAKEMKELYLWWTEVRPNRMSPYEGEMYLKYDDMRKKRGVLIDNVFLDYDKNTPEEQELEDSAIQEVMDIEENNIMEDEYMLDRLIKIRRYLWT